MPDAVAIQDQIPRNHCFGCGPENRQGLGLKSYWDGDGAVCTFHPAPHHMAGPTHVLNGGILATIVDCHSVCTAIADAYRAAGRPLGSEPRLWHVTASLRLDYLAPTPIAAPVELRAWVRETKGRMRVVECEVSSEGQLRVRAEVLAVQVPETW